MSRSTIFVLLLLSILAAALVLSRRAGSSRFARDLEQPVAAADATLAPAAPETGTREPVAAATARGCRSAQVGSWFRFRVHDHTTCVVRGADGEVHTSVE